MYLRIRLYGVTKSQEYRIVVVVMLARWWWWRWWWWWWLRRRRREWRWFWWCWWYLPLSFRKLLCTFLSLLCMRWRVVCLLVGCLTSQQQASVSQGRICSDNFTCCHTEIDVADQTFYLTQSQYTDTGPTSPSADPITPGAWQGSHWSANFEVTGMTRPRKNPDANGIRTRDLPLSRRTP